MTNLVIGDVHNKSDRAEKIINEYDCPTILLGDYFDDFYDTVDDIQRTAEWLKESLSKPNRIHLIGNHDFHYMVKPKGITYCSGFSPEKYDKINEILTAEDWSKLKFFHHEKETYWFCHAGITKHWFEHPVLGLNLAGILKTVEECTEALKASDLSRCGALWAADRYRGGRCEKGGLLWNDWRNCEFFKGITQIIGHTPREEIKCQRKKGGININIDTHLAQVLELDTDNNSWNIKTI
jgi:hypothetical protein